MGDAVSPRRHQYVEHWSDWSSSAEAALDAHQRCWTSQASTRQVRVSGDRQTNKQTEGHRIKSPICGGGLKLCQKKIISKIRWCIPNWARNQSVIQSINQNLYSAENGNRIWGTFTLCNTLNFKQKLCGLLNDVTAAFTNLRQTVCRYRWKIFYAGHVSVLNL